MHKYDSITKEYIESRHYTEIIKEYGISYEGLRHIAERLGTTIVTNKKRYDESKLKELCGTMTDQEVADILGCSITPIFNYRLKHGIPPHRPKPKYSKECITDLIREYGTITKASEVTKIPSWELNKAISYWNISVCDIRNEEFSLKKLNTLYDTYGSWNKVGEAYGKGAEFFRKRYLAYTSYPSPRAKMLASIDKDKLMKLKSELGTWVEVAKFLGIKKQAMLRLRGKIWGNEDS